MNIKRFLLPFKNEDPFEQKLFTLVGIIGVLASFSSAILYLPMERHRSTGLICLGAGIFTILLLLYVHKTGRYLGAYLISIFGVFIGLFTVLFFSFGANSGYLFIMGLVFTCMLLKGKTLAIIAPLQVLWYFLVFLYTYYHPELIHDTSSPDKNFLMLVIGCLGCSAIICPSLLVYINTCKKAKKIAEEATLEAIEAGKAKDKFLAGMSHEIRTPINTILGMNDMIVRENGTANVNGYTDDIRSAGKELLDIIDNILDYSRMGAGKEKLHEITYSTASLIHKWEYTGNNLAAKKNLIFAINIDPSFPDYLYGDEAKINRVVINLISNAVKYTDIGSVKLHLGVTDINENEVFFSIKVKDTGHGIKKEDLSHLFQSFERLDQGKNYKVKGTGLGLAISKGLTELMNGTLTCESEYEVGSEFTFSLSQKISTEKEYQGEHVNTIILGKTIHAPNAHVLVVDDIESNRNVISLLLKRSGIKLDMAESGIEALSRCKQNRYDAVLMDYRMADMDGIETMNRIRALDEGEETRTPIIAVTADILDGTREKLLSAGFDDFLSKPVNEASLSSVLLQHLPKELASEVSIDDFDKNQTLSLNPKDLKGTGEEILIVDDDEGMHKIANAICREAGYTVSNAKSGTACVEMLNKLKDTPKELPSLILLDINMPIMDGYETFKAIREIPECAYIPIICMTSETSIETEVMCMELGAADFILKPFVKDIMLARIANHIAIAKNLQSEINTLPGSAGLNSDKLDEIKTVLSETELLITKMIAEGYSNREISEKTNYSYAYVKKVGSIIYEKLGVTSRTQLKNILR